MRPETVDPKTIDAVIRRHLDRLRKPGVLSVRPGYEIRAHQLTGRAAIVAIVHTKQVAAALPRGAALPQTLEGIAVDVREASAQQRLRAQDPLAAALTEAWRRPENDAPDWPLEREMPSGKRLTDRGSRTGRLLTRQLATEPAAARVLQAQADAAASNIPYVPAIHMPLDPVGVTATITAHVSPDAAFATLMQFLKATKTSLVIGMYDFTSGPILAAFEADLKSPKTLQMVLDNPAPNPTRNQTDSQSVADLDRALGSCARISRALTPSDPFAAKWMFPSAYHIKVIVRDHESFWLSSGNLNNSNQPDPASPPSTRDRDWHVIIEEPGLARTFAAYLNQDYLSASQNQTTDAQTHAIIEDAQSKLAAQANPPPPPSPSWTSASAGTTRTAQTVHAAIDVPAKTFRKLPVHITPLLTPDLLPDGRAQYLTAITQLIQSAQRSLYIQLQYIEASKGDGSAYEHLLQAIADRVHAGVDVRLIESAEYGEPWAEKMKAAGVDLTAHIRLQPNVHNKGFVVDSKTVVVSSQNFSPEGVQFNRDAGVIIESAEIASYFEPIFLADWQQAKPVATQSAPRKPAHARSAVVRKRSAPRASSARR